MPTSHGRKLRFKDWMTGKELVLRWAFQDQWGSGISDQEADVQSPEMQEEMTLRSVAYDEHGKTDTTWVGQRTPPKTSPDR